MASAIDNKTTIPRSMEIQLLSTFLSTKKRNRRMWVEYQRMYRVKNGVLEAAGVNRFCIQDRNWGPFNEVWDAPRLQLWAVRRVAYLTDYKVKAEMHLKHHQLTGFVEQKRAARVASKNVSQDVSGVAELF
jgi:hypothetical protein